MNSSIESLYKRLSENNFKKGAKIDELLSTQVWVLTDESALKSNNSDLKNNNTEKKSIAKAIETLTGLNKVIVKKKKALQ